MRLLAVHPGSGYSTGDVFNGMVPELRALGVDVKEYDLESRLDLSQRWLNLVWRQRGKPTDKYTGADVVYGASKDLLERALRWEVDGVLIFSAMFLHPDLLVLLRRAHIRTAVLLSESPYDDEKQARILPLVDVAWTNERTSVRTLRHANPNVNYLPHAFNPKIHFPTGVEEGDTSDAAWAQFGAELRGERPITDEDDVPAHDVVFVGSMFDERYELLSQVDWSGIDLGLYGQWSGLPSRSKLRQYVRGDVVDNRYAAALYRKAKIGLNLYRESIGWGKMAPRISHAESMNPRTLELAACGCFQISSYRQEIEDVFGVNVPTFRAASELDGLLRYYLQQSRLRILFANDARKAVQPHTFAARARTIIEDLQRAEWPVSVAMEQVAV